MEERILKHHFPPKTGPHTISNNRIISILLPSHIGTAARKHGWRRERRRFFASRWETGKFRAFSVREEAGLDGRVRSSAPRVVLRFESLVRQFRIKILTWSFKVSERVEIQPGGDGSRASEGSPLTGDEMRGHDGAADIHRSETRSQVLRTHQGSCGDAEPHRGSEGVL